RDWSSDVCSSDLATSAPAQNALPAPLTTTTRIRWRFARSRASAAHALSSAIACSLKALRTSGRLRARYSIGPSRVALRYWYDIELFTTKDTKDTKGNLIGQTFWSVVSFVSFVVDYR